MKKLLITGGAGFIGANFVHYWVKHYPQDKIVVLDALTYAGNFANLESVKNNDNFTFIHGDICVQSLVESLLNEHNIDTLVHFAAESHVDRSIPKPLEDACFRTPERFMIKAPPFINGYSLNKGGNEEHDLLRRPCRAALETLYATLLISTIE